MTPNHFALVTGSSSGIGKALAEEFARLKINVLLVALPGTGLRETSNHLRQQYKICCDYLEVDLTSAESPLRILEWCNANHYRVSILVNNAGFGNLSSFEKTSADLLCSMMLLNNHALVLLTHLFIPELKKNKYGYIMNVGSLASFLPIPNKSVYAATKSFVYTFSSALRLELKQYNINVSCLCPGGTVTNQSTMERIDKIKSGKSFFIQQPEEVAKEAVEGMLRKKQRIIPGWHNKLFFRLQQVLPFAMVCWILLKIFNPNRNVNKLINTSRAHALVYR